VSPRIGSPTGRPIKSAGISKEITYNDEDHEDNSLSHSGIESRMIGPPNLIDPIQIGLPNFSPTSQGDRRTLLAS
jgi:hypothetical protein